MEKIALGTKVRVKSYEEIKRMLAENEKTHAKEWPFFNHDSMVYSCGKSGKVISYFSNNHVHLDVDKREFVWAIDWLEVLDKQKLKNIYPGEELKIGLRIKGNVTKVFKDGYRGIAKCCPSDEFSMETGIKLAVKRAEQAKKDAEWPCNGDVFFYVGVDAFTGKAVVGNDIWTDPPRTKTTWKWQYKQNRNFFRTAEEALKVANACNDRIVGKK